MTDLDDAIAGLATAAAGQRDAAVALTAAANGQVAASTQVLALAARVAALAGTTQPPTPPPTPLPTPQGRRRVVWHHGWQGPPISSWPPDIRASATTVCVLTSQSAGRGSGKLTDPPGATRTEILALTSKGVDVFAGIGGGGDGGIAILDPAQIDQAVASILSMRDRLGYTGICWDLEGDPGQGWNPNAVATVSQRLVDNGVKVAIWSALYSGRLAAWGAVAKALGSRLDHWQRGFYDFGEARDSRLTGIVTGDLRAMRPYVTRDDQLVAAFAATTPGDINTSPIPVLAAAYAAGRQTPRPGSSPVEPMSSVGWAMYDSRIDAVDHGWAATRALAQL